MISSVSARLDGQGDVFGTATYSNNSFPPQYKSEAFVWTAAGGTQLLFDPANQPYSTFVDLGTDGSVLVRSNNPDPYTSYFDLMTPDLQVSSVPIPPAPAGYPTISSVSGRLDGQGDVFGTATYSNNSFPPQSKSEAFLWTAAGGTQLLLDPSNQPYSAVVDFGTDGSILVRSNNPDPFTSYFDLLTPDFESRAVIANPMGALIQSAGVSVALDPGDPGVVVGNRLTGEQQFSEFIDQDAREKGRSLRIRDQAFQWNRDRVPQVLTNRTNSLLEAFDDSMVEVSV
jgi:hypothetical protein